ncbi:caspase b-like [Brachyhypopomus gauderio]|uniref:caspase b-like n=1 Tax=Brachyhypopomus gauderio TaxID=698409 RepID=UPI00404260EA
MANVPVLILDSLSELLEEEFKSFKWQLTDGVAKGFRPISKGKLEKAKQTDVVDLMVGQYGLSEAGTITVRILQNIQHNNLADKLKTRLSDVQVDASASSTTSPASSTLGLTQNIKADQNSRVTAPVVSGATFNAPVNFSFN